MAFGFEAKILAGEARQMLEQDEFARYHEKLKLFLKKENLFDIFDGDTMTPTTNNHTPGPPADFQKRFDEDGYFVYEDMYSPAEVAQKRDYIDRVVKNTDQWPSRMFIYSGEGTDSNDDEVPTAIQAGHLHDWTFIDWVRDERILQVVRPLLGENIAVYNTSVFMKPPRSPVVIPWHQDEVYYAVTTEFLVACWVALTDVTIDNGALKYLKVGHRCGVLPTGPPRDANSAATFDREVMDIDPSRIVDVPVRAGSAIFHHSLLPHCSGPNNTDSPRWALALDYMPADYQFTGPGEARRCYPIVSGSRPTCQPPEPAD